MASSRGNPATDECLLLGPTPDLLRDHRSCRLLEDKRTRHARREIFRFWPNAELVQRLPSRQLLGVKRTRCAHPELFRV